MSWKLEQSFSALKHRNFRMFVVGQFISLIGFWMQSVGQSWLVYRLTQSSAYLGSLAFCQQVPILLFAFGFGGLVDRSNRRRLVILTQTLQLVQAAILAALTYANKITIPELFVLSAVLGIVGALDMPARQAFLIEMVSREDLMNAIAINSSMFNAARMVGPAIAGYVVAKWGEASCFLLNALSFLAVLVSLVLMKVAPVVLTPAKESLWQDLKEGLIYVRDTPPVRILLQLMGALGTLGFPFAVLLPVFADRIFQRGASGLGWMMAAIGIGALSGALFLAGRKGLRGMSRVLAVCTLGYSVSLLCFSYCPSFWLSFGLLILVGIFMMITIASVNTVIQSLIPDSFRGRVMSLFTTMLIGVAPIGSLIAGWLAKYTGVQMMVLIMSILCLATSAWFFRTVPYLRVEARRIMIARNPIPVEEAVAGRT